MPTHLNKVLWDAFAGFGGTITTREIISPQQTAMGPVLTKIAVDSPELLYFPLFMPAGGHIINQARTAAGLENIFLMGADGLFSADVMNATGGNIEGFLLTSMDLPQHSAEYYESFLPAYRTKFGTDPVSVFHAHAYDAFMLIKAAIQRVAVVQQDGTLQIGRQALRNALYGTQAFPGLTGDLTCSATGDCADTYIAVHEFHTGHFPPERIWPHISSVVSPERGGEVMSYHGDTTIQLPARAVTDTVVVTYTLAHGLPPDANLTGIGHQFELTAVYSRTGQPASLAPGHNYTVTVKYTDVESGPAR